MPVRSTAPRRAATAALAALALAALALVAAGCGGTSSGASGDGSGGGLNLVAYSTPQEAYEAITAAWAGTPEGENVSVQESFGSSGDQARAVEAGLPADIVALSLEPDIQKLVDAGIVAETWSDDEHGGMVTNSVVVFAVREGNPKGIRTWDDLIKPGVEIVTPNPATSGGAKWNIMAAYGAQLEQGRTPGEAQEYLRAMFGNVVAQDKSAREALQTFFAGKGDVLIAYENEAITAQQKGEELAYEIPDETILIENPIAVTENTENPEKARAFVDFLWSDEAQGIFAEEGYRPVNEAASDESRFPTPPGLFTIADLGGWAKVDEEFFDDADGIVPRIQSESGAPAG